MRRTFETAQFKSEKALSLGSKNRIISKVNKWNLIKNNRNQYESGHLPSQTQSGQQFTGETGRPPTTKESTR